MKNMIFWLSIALALISLPAMAADSVAPPTIACPTDFDPDDSVWVMVALYGGTEGTGLPTVREFFYEPDPLLRTVKPRFTENCSGRVASYIFEGKERRIWTVLHTPKGTIHFLRDKGETWKRGANVSSQWDKSDPVNPVKILVLFDKDGKAIARREVPY